MKLEYMEIMLIKKGMLKNSIVRIKNCSKRNEPYIWRVIYGEIYDEKVLNICRKVIYEQRIERYRMDQL